MPTIRALEGGCAVFYHVVNTYFAGPAVGGRVVFADFVRDRPSVPIGTADRASVLNIYLVKNHSINSHFFSPFFSTVLHPKPKAYSEALSTPPLTLCTLKRSPPEPQFLLHRQVKLGPKTKRALVRCKSLRGANLSFLSHWAVPRLGILEVRGEVRKALGPRRQREQVTPVAFTSGGGEDGGRARQVGAILRPERAGWP